MAGLSDERTRLVKRLEALEAEQAVLRKQLALVDQALALEAERPVTERVARKRPTNPPRSEVVAIVSKAAEKAGRPVSRQEALEAVTQAGLTIEGARPIEVLATMLWRSRNEGKIGHVEGQGYWPKDKPLPKRRG